MDIIKIKKIKNFCASKDILKREKKPPAGWEKIIASHVSDMDLASRTDKQRKLQEPETRGKSAVFGPLDN